MPEAESSSSISPELILGCLRRRRWWVVMPAVIIAPLTFVALKYLPKKYTSTATLVVVQQQVPQRYVTPTSTTDMTEALEATTQEVLSRTGLLAIIGEFGLYPGDRGRLSPEELAAKMRKKIDIEPIISRPEQKDIDAFKISFSAESPQKAQAVTNELTALFIHQNLESREHQAEVTTGFLKEQLEDAKNKLAAQEARVRDFKLQNLGQLPEQQNSNLAVLTGLQAQLQNTMASIARAQEQRVYLQSLLNGYRGIAAHGEALTSSATAVSNPLEAAKRDLADLRQKKAALLSIYTPQHPDVIKINEEIAQAEALLKTLRGSKDISNDDAQASGSSKTETEVSAGDSEVETAVAQVKSQLEANRLELENLAKDKKQCESEMAAFQQRLNLTPVREQQLAGLLRDYELLKQDYTDLLSKETQSQLAGNLEKRQAGQQFRLVDRPSLPVVPSFPKRVPIALGGLGAGLVLGAALAFLIDIKDGVFYSEKDFNRVLQAPLVVGIPLILTESEKRNRIWQTRIEWLAGCCLGLAVLTLEFYELYLKRHG